mmetsp:Transcript_25632/g.71627  ORF Transcript_25632/g.71627 Transcript_25632/m.71627 type:complete len:263 (+) Transcript_25632:1003-1791(+)
MTALFCLVLPHTIQEHLAANLFARRAFRNELLLDLQLGCDTGVVGAWQPQNGTTAHAMESRQNILQGNEDGMSHVQTPSDVGRRHRQHVWLLAVVLAAALGVGQEALAGLPPLVNVCLKFGRVVGSLQPPALVDEVVGSVGFRAIVGRCRVSLGGFHSRRKGRESVPRLSHHPEGMLRRLLRLVVVERRSHDEAAAPLNGGPGTEDCRPPRAGSVLECRRSHQQPRHRRTTSVLPLLCIQLAVHLLVFVVWSLEMAKEHDDG